jgi:hypothetical protein
MFKQYIDAGIIVIPEKNGIPTTKLDGKITWGHFYRDAYKPTEMEVAEWEKNPIGYGLVTGEPSNIIAIDVDIDDKDCIEFIDKKFGETPCKKFGTKGITLFYKYNGEKNKLYKKDKKIVVELKSTGQKVTIPPSPHYSKKGVVYAWQGLALLDCYKNLPTLPDNFDLIIRTTFETDKEVARQEYKTEKYFGDVDYNTVSSALNYISPSCSYDEWKTIGASIYNEFGDAGFTMFENWSSSGSTFNAKEIYHQWKGCQSYQSITIGTLFYHAKQGGFTMPSYEEKVTTIENIDVADYSSDTLTRVSAQLKKESELPPFYTEAPSHIKEIADWIVESSYYSNPILAFGAACAVTGFLMGSDYEFKGVKPNLFFAGLASTGSGKETVLRCARSLTRKVLGGSENIKKGFTSTAGIMQALKGAKPKGYVAFISDELQSMMASMAHSSQGSEANMAGATLLELYTGEEFEGRLYANKKDTEEKGGFIENPFVSIIGFSTQKAFFGSLQNAQASNGFLGRLTVFEGNKLLPPPNKNYRSKTASNPPERVVDALLEIKRKAIVSEYKGQQMKDVVEPTLTPEAEEYLANYEEEIRNKRNEMRVDDNEAEFVFVRTVEQMKKYCLIGSCGDLIDLKLVKWARNLAEYNLGIICRASENFAENKYQVKVLKVLNYIKNNNNGIVEKSKIATNIKVFESTREREDIIKELVERGSIAVVKGQSSDKATRPCTYYKAL